MQTISQQIQGYTEAVQLALQSYLEENGSSGSGAEFEMPPFTMPEIPAPVINIPEIPEASISISIPSIDLGDIEMPSISIPEISVPEIASSDIEVPDISISAEISDVNYSYLNGSDDMSTFDATAAPI